VKPKTVLSIGIVGILVWVCLGLLLLIPWQVAGVLIAASVGISTLFFHYEREKLNESVQPKNEKQKEDQIKQSVLSATEREIQNHKIETLTKKEQTQKNSFLPDEKDIFNLAIDNYLLDQIYEQAHSQVIRLYHDAQLARFIIQVFLMQQAIPHVTIFFFFYSKWADKLCCFRYGDNLKMEHSTPDKPVKEDVDRKVFEKLPWRESPEWMSFLKMAYAKITPLSPSFKTYYSIASYAFCELPWTAKFEDGFSGNEFSFDWNGKGLDEKSIKQIH
jgi:hypothetical protein